MSDAASDLVLNVEHVLQLAVVPFAPHGLTGACLDQLGCNSQPLPGAPQAAGEYVAGAELPGFVFQFRLRASRAWADIDGRNDLPDAEPRQDRQNQHRSRRQRDARSEHLVGVIITDKLAESRDDGEIDGETIRKDVRNDIQHRPQFDLLGVRKYERRSEFKGPGHAANDDTAWTFEPHVAERVFKEMLAEHKKVLGGCFLSRY